MSLRTPWTTGAKSLYSTLNEPRNLAQPRSLSELLGSTWRSLALAADRVTAYISTIGASSPLLRSCKELPSPIAISLRDRGALNFSLILTENNEAPETRWSLGATSEQPSPEVCSRLGYVLRCRVGMALKCHGESVRQSWNYRETRPAGALSGFVATAKRARHPP